MNKLFKLSALMLSALLLTTACKQTGDPTPEPQPEAQLELAFSAGQVTSTSITFTVTPNQEDATYYAQLFAAEELAEERNVAMKAALMTMEEAYTGTQTITVEELTAQSDYKVLYFGYDATEKRYTTDYLVSDVIKTADFEISETITLELVEGSETWRNAYIKVSLSDENLEYIFDIMEKSKWEELYAADPETVVAARIAGWEQDVLDGLESNPTMDVWQKYMAIYQHSYPRTINASEYYNMYWDTEYVMYAFGMNDDGFQTTSVAVVEFKTATPEASNNTFSVEIGELTASSVAFTVTTTNNDPYFLTIQDKRYVDRFFGENATESWEDMIWDLTFVKTDEQIEDYIFTGSQSLTNADINKNVDTLHEYQVVIWGFNEGPTTEVYVSDVFKPFEEVVELSLYLTIDNVTSDTLTVSVDASTDEAAYYIGCITAEEFGSDYGLSYISSLCGTLTEEYLYYGSETYLFEGLAPETEYYVIAFGYDVETGEPTTDLAYKNERTMPAAVAGEVFTVAVNDITWRNAQISVATEYAGTYIYGLMTAAEFAEFTDANAIFEARKAGWESSAEWYDNTTWLDMMAYDFVEGNTNFDAGEEIMTLTYGESYVFYCMGVTAEGQIDTAMTVAEFSTLSPEPSNNEFTITIDSMTKSSVNFTVTPTIESEQYYVTVQRVSVLNGYGPDADKSYEDLIRYLTPESDFTLESRLFSGEQSLTNSSVGATVNGFYEYRVVVWGFNNGPTTTVYMSDAFKPADPE
ncbi:MAG: hypothetical protein IKV29_06520 [Alistipes sp.]|nr:hypothetical protein [Alistipes sp.]